jgi:hypothetical protein
MLLARTAARQKEIATRLALGSSVDRLAQQFLVEGVLLALFGGIAGLFAAFALAPALLRFLLAGAGPSGLKVLPDLNVIGLTLAVSALTGALFGLGPALGDETECKPRAEGRDAVGYRRVETVPLAERDDHGANRLIAHTADCRRTICANSSQSSGC